MKSSRLQGALSGQVEMESAQERKARLKAIRQAAGDVTPAAPPAAAEQPKLKFRNYNVRDQKIEHTVLEPAKAPEYVATKPEVPAGKTAEDLLANVAPKKPNWDLRRDVEKRLGKLERRTQRALVQLAQEQQVQSIEAQ